MGLNHGFNPRTDRVSNSAIMAMSANKTRLIAAAANRLALRSWSSPMTAGTLAYLVAEATLIPLYSIALQFGLQPAPPSVGLPVRGVLVATPDETLELMTRRRRGSSVHPPQRDLRWFPVSEPFRKIPESAVRGA